MDKIKSAILLAVICVFSFAWIGEGNSAMLYFNSPGPSSNDATRDAWLAAIGVSSPEHLVDFETGFINGQNIHGVSGLFPEGLIISDTDAHNAVISTGGINGSNPVGQFAVTQNEDPYLELDFSVNPVDYVGFQDIDQAGTTGVVTFVDATTALFSFETTQVSGNSAEFFGIYRNDMPRIIKVELDASGDGLWGVDNIEYGQVPVPSAVWLLGSGLIGMVGFRRRLSN